MSDNAIRNCIREAGIRARRPVHGIILTQQHRQRRRPCICVDIDTDMFHIFSTFAILDNVFFTSVVLNVVIP